MHSLSIENPREKMGSLEFEQEHSFGFKSDVAGSVSFLDETTLAYPCGHTLVLLNNDAKSQRFIALSENSSAVTAMTCSPNHKYVAVAEQSNSPTITLYEVQTLKRRKVLTAGNVESEAFQWLSFSADSKLLLALTDQPDYAVVGWAWEKGKEVFHNKVSSVQGNKVYQADFSPWDSSLVCVSGNEILKIFKIQDGVMKQLSISIKHEIQHYLCHAWVQEDRVVVGTDTGNLLILDSYELKVVIPINLDHEEYKDLTAINTKALPVYTIISYSKGFICGCAQNLLRIFEKADDPQDYYTHTKTFVVEKTMASVKSLSVNPSEDYLACVLSNNQSYLLGLSNTDILKAEEMSFEQLSAPVHAPAPFRPLGETFKPTTAAPKVSKVTGLGVCVRKPLIASSGTDCTVRIWDYIEHTSDMIKAFEEEPCSLSFHPSGFHLLVGFPDKLRLLNLLMDDIRCYKSIPIKSCKMCSFCHGGMYFAAVNGNTIQVFHSYSFECMLTLRGHGGKVNSLVWSKDDRYIVSTGASGQLLCWSVKSGEVEKRLALEKNSHFITAIPGDESCSTVYASTSDGFIRAYDMNSSSVLFEFECLRGICTKMLLLHSCQTLVCALNAPQLPGLLVSLKVTTNPGGFEVGAKTVVHSGDIVEICPTSDEEQIFTAGSDGSIGVFKAKNSLNKKRERESNLPFAEEILVTRADLEEKTTMMRELKNKVDELTLHNEYQLRLKDMNYNKKIDEITTKFNEELDLGKKNYEALTKEKATMIEKYKEKFKNIADQQQEELNKVVKSYEAKVQAEKKRHENLVEEQQEQRQRWEEENQKLIEQHDKYVASLTRKYEGFLRDAEDDKAKIEVQKKDLLNEFETSKHLIEDDADFEIDDLKLKYDLKLKQEKEYTIRLKGENAIMRKKFALLHKELEDQKEDIKSVSNREKELLDRKKGLEKDIQGHKKEIREREETINDKEKRIYDLKKKNQELEKFKFVLDYKIKELKKQIEPRENEIVELRQQTKEMDSELGQYHKSNAALDLMIGELRLKIEGMQKEIDSQNAALAVAEKFSAEYSAEIAEANKVSSRPSLLKARIIAMYKTYIQLQPGKAALKKSSGEKGTQEDSNRQRDYLEKSVESLKQKLSKDMKLHKAERLRLMRESVELTKEINVLRREYKALELAHNKRRTRKLSS